MSVSVLLLAGCGGPEYTYVTNSENRTHLRIPLSWQAVDSHALGLAFGIDPALDDSAETSWMVGYDADTAPSTAHVIGAHAGAPALLMWVQDVPPTVRGTISLDSMRDLFQPVSQASREQINADPATPFTDFRLIADQVLTPGAGLRGVRVVYRYRIQGGPVQVFDKTVYANDDASKIYMFYVRCSVECYRERKQEIENVVSSFTVREAP